MQVEVTLTQNLLCKQRGRLYIALVFLICGTENALYEQNVKYFAN
jgi:hypothetical protein